MIECQACVLYIMSVFILVFIILAVEDKIQMLVKDKQ